MPNETEKLTLNDQFNEYVMTGLRTIWGISLEKVQSNFGVNYKDYLLKSAEKFINQDLLVIARETKQSFGDKEITTSIPLPNDIEFLKTTKKGKFLADGLASELFKI